MFILENEAEIINNLIKTINDQVGDLMLELYDNNYRVATKILDTTIKRFNISAISAMQFSKEEQAILLAHQVKNIITDAISSNTHSI